MCKFYFCCFCRCWREPGEHNGSLSPVSTKGWELPELGVLSVLVSEAIKGGGTSSVLWGFSVLFLKVSSPLDDSWALPNIHSSFTTRSWDTTNYGLCTGTNGNKPLRPDLCWPVKQQTMLCLVVITSINLFTIIKQKMLLFMFFSCTHTLQSRNV